MTGKRRFISFNTKAFIIKTTSNKKGKRGGLQYHHKKNECGYLIEGKLKVKYDDGTGTLKQKILSKGSSFHFPPGLVHQEIALTNCKILEASSPHFNDRVRVENKYGLKIQHGLPSTKRRDVKIK